MRFFSVVINEMLLNIKLIAKISLSMICVFTLFFTIVSYLADYTDLFDSYIEATSATVDYLFKKEPKQSDFNDIALDYPAVAVSNQRGSLISNETEKVVFFNFLGEGCDYSKFAEISKYVSNNHDKSLNNAAWIGQNKAKEIGLNVGASLFVYSTKTNSNYSFVVEGIIPEEYVGYIIVSFEYYQYFSNDYYAFTIHDQLELKKVGPILSPYYINHGLLSTDMNMGMSIYYYMQLAYKLLFILLIIVFVFLVFSLFNFTNVYYHLRNKYMVMLKSLGLNIHKKIFMVVFIIIFIPSSLIGFLLSMPVIRIIWVQICEIIPIDLVSPSFLIYLIVIVITIIFMIALCSLKKITYEVGDRE